MNTDIEQLRKRADEWLNNWSNAVQYRGIAELIRDLRNALPTTPGFNKPEPRTENGGDIQADIEEVKNRDNTVTGIPASEQNQGDVVEAGKGKDGTH